MNESHETKATEVDRSALSGHHSSFARVFRLARKELREILRDRRTIVTLIAMPLLLYPVMSVVFLQFSLASKATLAPTPEYRVGTLTTSEARTFQYRFDKGQEAWRRAHGQPAAAPRSPKKARAIPHLVWYYTENPPPTSDRAREQALDVLKGSLREGMIDLIVEIPTLDPADVEHLREGPAQDRVLPCKIYAMPNNGVAQAALAHIEAIFAAVNLENLKERLNAPGIAPHAVILSVKSEMLEPAGADGLISLAALVPLILILMTITGAVYPAIDLTAGERERGTLEILVAAPVPRFELLAAKYVSVVTVAVLNAIVNLVCMTITVLWSGVSSLLPGVQELSPLLLLQVMGLLLLFAAFFSAVLLCLTSFARSFKEAQAYLIPLMLVSLGPGIMAMMPGLKLDGVLAVLPLVNIVLMARDLFEGGVGLGTGTVVVLTTLLYALAALALAARVFGAESVLYSEQSSWSDLLRRPEEPQPAATIPAALWCLALMVPFQFGLFALLRSLGPIAPIVGIVLGVAVNLLLFGLLPSLFLYLGRVEIRQGLGLSMPPPAALIAGLLLGASLWPLELKLLDQSGVAKVLEERFGSTSVLESFKQAREQMGWWVLAIVIVPAILEEIFFRGLLFNALKARCGAAVTIGVSGLLFGLTHVILDGVLGLERLVPSTILGLILGAVCWQSGSLWPGMILHVCHNAILLGVGLTESGSIKEIPWEWLAGGAIGTALGGLLLWQWGRATAKKSKE
jgi:sodium transport system permease protein